MLKGKIDKKGDFFIERSKKKYQKQICPFNRRNYFCGDWCPHFGEPEEFPEYKIKYLQICQGRALRFSELIDERPK